MRRLLAALPLALSALACGSDAAPSDVANGVAAAGCEAATDALLAAGPEMLPGRQCLLCHMAGASAAEKTFSAGGSVFAKGKDVCNNGGPSGAVVELLKADGTVVASTTTNAKGNFFFRQSLAFPLKARVTYNGKQHDMPGNVTSGDCASCHNGTMVERINVE
jgi:hypothetical protein